ncbi:MAG: hypothetical protein R3B70_38545 [Polyangiaceae bacterium]
MNVRRDAGQTHEAPIPRRAKAAALCALALAGLTSCDEPEVFIPLQNISGPAGVIDGSVTYAGPLPCTKDGKILGAAVILAFEENLLPPPEGLGTTAASLDVVPGEVLFDGVRDKLAFAADGTLVCGNPLGETITVSGNWGVGPFAAGTYQIRGFYDKYGDFDPAFSISNLPTKGDIGGGAVDNATEVLEGAAPVYRSIPLGVPGEDGKLVIPEEGYRVSGVAVTLGLPLPLERPIFHASGVLDESGKNTDPKKVTMASDYQFEEFSAANPLATEKSFLRMKFAAGLPDDKLSKYNKTEPQIAKAPPFSLDLDDPFLLYTRQDVNGDGQITSADHIPDSTLIPALFPVAVFVKLNDGVRIGSQAAPTIVLQGLTIYKNLVSTATAPADLNAPSSEIIVGVRPAVVCIDTNDPTKPGVLLTSHPDDTLGNLLIEDEDSVRVSLESLFNRPFSLAYGCLPQGEYSMNLVYDSGQAWTVPNEAGVCAASEEPADNGQTCGTRPRLPSQDVVLTIGAPNDASYCKSHPTPPACLPAPAEAEE